MKFVRPVLRQFSPSMLEFREVLLRHDVLVVVVSMVALFGVDVKSAIGGAIFGTANKKIDFRKSVGRVASR